MPIEEGEVNSAWKTQAKENFNYYQGDTFQYWIGPVLPSDDPNASEVNAEVERIFTTNNLIAECADRHAHTLVGTFPQWHLYRPNLEAKEQAQDSEEDAALTAGERLLTEWIKSSGFDSVIIKAATRLAVQGRTHLRIYTPRRFQELPEESLRRVAVHVPEIDQIEIYEDDDGFVTGIIYTSGEDYEETLTVDLASGNLLIEVEGEEDRLLPLNGRWTIQDIQGPTLVSSDVKQCQNSINLALTMLNRNNVSAGFLERVITNAQLPGQFQEINGTRVFVPDLTWRVGPGVTTFLTGVEGGDPGNPTVLEPKVTYHEPTAVTTFTDSLKTNREILYHRFGQGHLLSAGDGSVSGVSRVQLRSDSRRIIREHSTVLARAISNVLWIVLQQFDDGLAQQVAVAVEPVITDTPTPEERQAIREQVEAGLLSKSSAMVQLGVKDPDAELALMGREGRTLDAPLLSQLTQMLLAGVISSEAFYQFLQWGDFLPPTFDVTAELARGQVQGQGPTPDPDGAAAAQ